MTGSGGVKIEIKLVPQQTQNQQHYGVQPPPAELIPLDHFPSWKLHKNPFWRVKHPSLAPGIKLASIAPSNPTAMGNSMSMSGGGMGGSMMGGGMGGDVDVMSTKSQLFAYEAQQDVGGIVTLYVAPGKKIEHLGIKVQFIGRIDMVRGVACMCVFVCLFSEGLSNNTRRIF